MDALFARTVLYSLDDIKVEALTQDDYITWLALRWGRLACAAALLGSALVSVPARAQSSAQAPYVVDRWNTDVSKWEAQLKTATADMKVRYEKELAMVRAQREKAQYNLKLLEKASATAWGDFTQGADEAWDRALQNVALAIQG